MLFILPDFLKVSTPAVSSKFFHPPPPPPFWTKKVPVASPECLYSIGWWTTTNQNWLTIHTPLYD